MDIHQPKHPKTNHFLNSGLFDDLKSFNQLESRIEQLPTNQDKGDAFEVLAEAYLAVQKQYQVQNIWSFVNTPLSIKQELHLPNQDMGIDGVYQDIQQNLCAYQVKFRSDRSSLNWANELSQFMGLSDFAYQKVLFTNSDSIPSIMRDRKDFISIRGNDLDRLEIRDFESIRAWMQGEQVTFVPKSPRYHQQTAIDDVIKGLESEDRVTTVMPCGTGKTLVALWIAERLKCQKILVLVPSLALLRQTLHEWMKETQWDKVSILSVCSDPTVQKQNDDWMVEQCDLDFPVTTESQVVNQFLRQETDATKIVFSTYQSSPVVAGGMGGTDSFDFAIFDEAHKTAGRQGTKFSFALDDEKLPIKKRLFMTATPRHYDVSKKNKEGEHQLVYSMDVPETYGEQVHQLSFAKAIEQDIICDYKVAISVVTSKEVNNHILSQGEVLVEGDLVRAKQVANQIALQRAVEKYQTGKIITFHGVVKSAKSFVSQGNEGVGYHLHDFDCWHVNGTMPTSNREQIMKEFRSATNSIISNARCLTEGVDVPALDMVCFMSPKKSKVDIVQATGRAMRKSEGKDYGYILIPLFLELKVGEPIEEALERTDFKEVHKIVVNEIRVQDKVLNDIIRQMRVDKGRTKGFDDSRFREKVEILGAEIDLETLRKVITAELIESLGLSWDEMYGQLIAYKEEHGDCNVPKGYPDNLRLGNWVGTQRQRKKQDKLSSDKIQQLEAIGFSWNPDEDSWNQMYQVLQEYKQIYGDCDVPRGYSDNPQLATWVNGQRAYKRKGKLSTEQIQKLDAIGFSWDPHEDFWHQMFQALQEYKRVHGDCNVPRGYSDSPQLATWVDTQRQQKKRGKLSTEWIQKLEEIGFSWDPTEDLWHQMFQALQEYKRIQGHCNVPQKHPDNLKLGAWVSKQRQQKKRDKLSTEQIQKLEAIGFSWDPDEDSWYQMFQALQEYKRIQGHCNVPQKYPDNLKLGAWVSKQRQQKKRGKLSTEWIQKLEAIGFSWDPDEDAWHEMFLALKEYKRSYGDCNVPDEYPDNLKLGKWVSWQRHLKKQDKLSTEWIRKLEAIGFSWDPIEDFWHQMFQALQEHKRIYGHCNVPQKYPDNLKLGAWINTQRQRKKQDKLSSDKIEKLEAIGFSWDTLEDAWHEMFLALKEYKRVHGHCNLPAKYPDNLKLGRWVNTQRQQKKLDTLSQDRIQKLEAIGFSWDTLEDAWHQMFQALQEYKRIQGHCNVPQKYPDNLKLGTWVDRQRRAKKRDKLSTDKIQKLDQIGFQWTPRKPNSPQEPTQLSFLNEN